MYLTEQLQGKWEKVLNHESLPEIKDPYRRAVTTLMLENQKIAMDEQQNLNEDAPTNNYGDGRIGAFDPVLISLVRRSMPNLIAYDVCAVQPMTGPTGLIFAMRAKYTTQAGTEALYNEADSDFGGTGTHAGTNPSVLNDASPGTYTAGGGMSTHDAESLGDSSTNNFAEMGFSIDKVTVTAQSRKLKAEYTHELAQDLKAIHGLDAETELANILSAEILAENNREVIRKIYISAEAGAQVNTTTAGTFDLDTDSNGRWSVEKFKGLLFQIEREANAINVRTRRGKGNILICSSDVASALAMAGVLDYNPALQNNLNVDDSGNTFAGVLNGRYRVYVDPYSANVSASQYFVVGYKGTSPYDAGMFYCPYVPLQMVRAVGENSFQPKIGFQTRYGLVSNPFANTSEQALITGGTGQILANDNRYYRRIKVANIM
jgi:hypothetical protein